MYKLLVCLTIFYRHCKGEYSRLNLKIIFHFNILLVKSLLELFVYSLLDVREELGGDLEGIVSKLLVSVQCSSNSVRSVTTEWPRQSQV